MIYEDSENISSSGESSHTKSTTHLLNPVIISPNSLPHQKTTEGFFHPALLQNIKIQPQNQLNQNVHPILIIVSIFGISVAFGQTTTNLLIETIIILIIGAILLYKPFIGVEWMLIVGLILGQFIYILDFSFFWLPIWSVSVPLWKSIFSLWK